MPGTRILRCKVMYLRTAAFCAGLWLAHSVASAGVFMNINFDGQNVGDPINTTYPLAPSPVTDAYATEGFPDTPPYTGTNTVYSAVGLNKAALMSTNQGGTGANYIDTQFLVTGNIITLDFDIQIVAQTLGVYPQGAPNTPNGQLFVINAFALDSSRVFRFAATPSSPTQGFFAMRNNTDGDLIHIGANYDVGTTYHVSVLANYLTNTVDVSVSGIGSLNNLPFIAPQAANGGMEEYFIFQNNIEGFLNQVALDNIVGQTLPAVPEPSSMAVLSIGLLSMIGIARRRRVG